MHTPDRRVGAAKELKQKERESVMKRDRMGRYSKSMTRKVIEFEVLLLGSVAVLGLLIYFWTPIAINAAAEKVATVYTSGF